MITLLVLLALIAFGVTIASALGKAPLWIAVLLLCLIELIHIVPVR